MDEGIHPSHAGGRDAKGRWLTGFCPNPVGKTPGVVAAIKKFIGEHGEHGVAFLWRRIVMAEGDPAVSPEGEFVARADRVPSWDLRAATARWLVERACGGIPLKVEAQTTSDAPMFDMSKLSDDQVKQFVALLAEARGG